MDILKQTVDEIKAKGKGILAADESTPTCTKRFESIGVESTEESRRDYREMLFSTPGIGEFISGVILFEETLKQKTKDGKPMFELIKEQGMVPGIKVDKGLVPLENTDEKTTQGLDGLSERLVEYKKFGARFAKWRSVFSISDTFPTQKAVAANAHALAHYAHVCQENGFVPIVEPEVLINGNHSLEKCREVTISVLKDVYKKLKKHDIFLEGTILKPSMVISGMDNNNRASVKEVAKSTIEVLKECVPENVPTINFLSGGQTPEEATAHLQALNKIGGPWNLSFSYGRALQEPALKAWMGKEENMENVQKVFYKRARYNSLAVKGEYSEEMEGED